MEIIHWIGIDDHADKWTIAYLRDWEDKPTREFELIPDEKGYRKLLAFAKTLGGTVRIVYEAGPCGYDLYRRLNKAGLRCEVAAPSLTPHKPGQRVKTNRRDALKLARYLRAGELTLIVVPDEDRESLRDLIRARTAALKDLLSIRHQIAKLLLRYGHRYRDGRAWTQRFWSWLEDSPRRRACSIRSGRDGRCARRARRAGGPLHRGHRSRGRQARVRPVHRRTQCATRDRHRVGDDDPGRARRPAPLRYRAAIDGRHRSGTGRVQYRR
jgi:transposase